MFSSHTDPVNNITIISRFMFAICALFSVQRKEMSYGNFISCDLSIPSDTKMSDHKNLKKKHRMSRVKKTKKNKKAVFKQPRAMSSHCRIGRERKCLLYRCCNNEKYAVCYATASYRARRAPTVSICVCFLPDFHGRRGVGVIVRQLTIILYPFLCVL